MTPVWIGVGSNLDPKTHINSGLVELKDVLLAVRHSRVFESEAIGFVGPAFYNLVVTGQTELGLTELLASLREIEYRHGRSRDCQGSGSRWLDLDLLFFGELCCQQPVELPRAEITQNAFVLWPLAELSPDWRHPQLQHSMAELWAAYPQGSQRLQPIEFDWSD